MFSGATTTIFIQHTLLRSVGDPGFDVMDESDDLRSASALGPVGIDGTVLSPKIL